LLRLASYWRGRECRGGLVNAGALTDLEAALKAAGSTRTIAGLRDFLELQDWRDWLARIGEGRGLGWKPLAQVKLAAPIPRPGQLILSGANTFSHLAEAARLIGTVEPPRRPMVLAKAASSISGPFDDIVMPPETSRLDYEVEIGAVIGKTCRRQTPQTVREFIAGYMVLNDVAARDVQMPDDETNAMYRTHLVGKSFDTFAPSGPWITLLDDLPAGTQRMRTFVNGEVRQDGDTGDLIHPVENVVAHLSMAMTLQPGDIVTSGTPAGVALFGEPPRWLQPGDVVACEVEGLGRIENRVVAERA
jgi:2-keto-4-pentenoate hydratase/2-oxohepta-3-ene-1,7-dioic acid hydratase in catechol pathway